MRLIKWLLSHLLLITILVVVALAVWQHERMSDWYHRALAVVHNPGPVATVPAEHPAAPPSEPSAPAQREAPAESPQTGAHAPPVAPPAQPAAQPPAKRTAPDEASARTGTTGKPGAPPGAAPQPTPPPATALSPTPPGPAESSATTEAQTTPTPDGNENGPLDAAQRQALAQARRAFWDQDNATALSRYRSLIAARPDDPDLHGEYGNVLFAEGKTKAALEQYEKAARGLLHRHRYAEFDRLARIMTSIDPDYGPRLRAMAAASRPGSNATHGAQDEGSRP